MATPSALNFVVKRGEPELITPAKPTPKEYKNVSDIDAQERLRFHIPIFQIYRSKNCMGDPVKVIKKALAETLVYYYPFAGRLREMVESKQLYVECTGEGVLFIEADADVRLDDFGDALYPPFPSCEELLFDAPASDDLLGSPLLLFQVTRLKCGSFILGLRLNHVMCDAPGIIQFMKALAELARGANAPSVLPVWKRELLNSPQYSTSTSTNISHNINIDHHNKETSTFPVIEMQQQTFFFGLTELNALRRHVPPHLQKSSTTFEVLTACLWRCRTRAMQLDPEKEACVLFAVNARTKFSQPLPRGYYGNTFVFSAALTKAGKLCQNPIGFAIELLRKCKSHEVIRSGANYIRAMKEQPLSVVVAQTFLVSNVTHAGYRDVDFGWGKAVYGGPAKGEVGPMPGGPSFYISFTNKNGEEGIVVPISLPAYAMPRFVIELNNMLKDNDQLGCATTTTTPYQKSRL